MSKQTTLFPPDDEDDDDADDDTPRDFLGRPIPPPPVGRERRDRALARVGREPFMSNAMAAVAALPLGWEGTGEDLRFALTAQGIVPSDPHAWGAVVMTAVRRKYIRKTGERRQMKDPGSHARDTAVYKTF